MKDIKIKVHEIAVDGLPPAESLTGCVAFIWDGCLVSGWPLGRDLDCKWEANSDVGRHGEFGDVTHWVEFPEPMWDLEKSLIVPKAICSECKRVK